MGGLQTLDIEFDLPVSLYLHASRLSSCLLVDSQGLEKYLLFKIGIQSYVQIRIHGCRRF
jgi:hypothetical protein